LQVSWVVTAGPLYGLIAVCWLAPILNRIFPAPQHSWRAAPKHPPKQEEVHA
jgi:hypothetical protein